MRGDDAARIKKHQRIFKSIKVFKTKFPVNNINSYDLIGDFKQSNRNKVQLFLVVGSSFLHEFLEI